MLPSQPLISTLPSCCVSILQHKIGRPAAVQWALVDPKQRCIAMHLYDGLLQAGHCVQGIASMPVSADQLCCAVLVGDPHEGWSRPRRGTAHEAAGAGHRAHVHAAWL